MEVASDNLKAKIPQKSPQLLQRILRLGIYWQDAFHLDSSRCTLILLHLYVKAFPLENENSELLFHFQSSPVPPIFGIVSCCRTWNAKRDPRHPICCGWRWSWTVPPGEIAQGGAQKSGNTRIKIARGLARLSWCHMVPLAVQQKSTKKDWSKIFWDEKSLLEKVLQDLRLGSGRCRKTAPEAQLRRRCDSLRRSRPPWLAASGDRQAAEVAAPRPGRHKRLGFVGRLGKEHGVGESPSAPHPRWRPVGILVQGRGSANTRSHRYRSHWWPGSLGQLHRATTAPFVKYGRVWWVEILGKAGEVDGAGFE